MLDDAAPLAFALIVVTVGGRVLMVFDRDRGQWELPGGMLDPGETARQAAVRAAQGRLRESGKRGCLS